MSIDDTAVEVTVNSGHGHEIVLLFTSKDCQTFVSVKQITYFGDLLNIVNLRRNGFYDDVNILTDVHSDCDNYEFFRTHAKKYVNALLLNNMRSVANSIVNAISVGMNKLIKNGLSSEALQKKQQHEQTITDNTMLYELLKSNIDDSPVRTVIKSVIDTSYEDLSQLQSHSIMLHAEYTDPYTGESYSIIRVTDKLVSNPYNTDENRVSIANGLTFTYVLHLKSATQELNAVDNEVSCALAYDLAKVQYDVFKKVKYVCRSCFEYDVKREIFDACLFMRDDTRLVTYEQIAELVKAFTKSIVRVNKLISCITNATID